MCILLVEDEPLIREFVVEILTSAGFSVCEAKTGEQAVGLIEYPPEEFSLLITDIDLPGKHNGLSVANLIRRQHPLLPVIYMTGRPGHFASLGLRETLLPKPFKIQKLLVVVQELLERNKI